MHPVRPDGASTLENRNVVAAAFELIMRAFQGARAAALELVL